MLTIVVRPGEPDPDVPVGDVGTLMVRVRAEGPAEEGATLRARQLALARRLRELVGAVVVDPPDLTGTEAGPRVRERAREVAAAPGIREAVLAWARAHPVPPGSDADRLAGMVAAAADGGLEGAAGDGGQAPKRAPRRR